MYRTWILATYPTYLHWGGPGAIWECQVKFIWHQDLARRVAKILESTQTWNRLLRCKALKLRCVCCHLKSTLKQMTNKKLQKYARLMQDLSQPLGFLLPPIAIFRIIDHQPPKLRPVYKLQLPGRSPANATVICTCQHVFENTDRGSWIQGEGIAMLKIVWQFLTIHDSKIPLVVPFTGGAWSRKLLRGYPPSFHNRGSHAAVKRLRASCPRNRALVHQKIGGHRNYLTKRAIGTLKKGS